MDERIIKKLLEEQGADLILTGSWIITIGTVIAAVGQTKVVVEDGSISGRESVVIGSGVESFGNVLQAIGRDKLNEIEPTWGGKLAAVGCWTQAAGNAANAVGVQRIIEGELLEEQAEETEGNEEEDEEELSAVAEGIIHQGQQINGLGSDVQAAGAAIEVYGVANIKPEISTPYEIAGNSIIAIGSAVEGIGSVYNLQNREDVGEKIELVGAYIQVVGSAIELYGLSIARAYKESTKEDRQQEKYSYQKYNQTYRESMDWNEYNGYLLGQGG